MRASAKPYTGWAGFHYDQQLPEDTFIEAMVTAARHDIRIVTLPQIMLPYIERAARAEPRIRDRRWVLSHIGVMDDATIARVRDLGLVVSANTNRYLHRNAAQFLREVGESRANDISPLRRLKDADIVCSLATDNMPASLFYPVWEAVARKDRTTGDIVGADERLTRQDALRAATINGAHLSMSERDKGSIEVGKLADFVVLPQDPLTCAEDDIKGLTADITVVGGRIAFQRQ